MEREKRNDLSFSRKRSFTFGAYGGVDRFTCGDENRSGSGSGSGSSEDLRDLLDPPCSRNLDPLSLTRDSELFEIIEKLQGSRLDEQRCEFPLPLKSQLWPLDGGLLPLVLPSKGGGYWTDPPMGRLLDLSPAPSPPSPTPSEPGPRPHSYDLMERDAEAKIYQQHFSARHHHSFTAVDPSLGPLVLSVCLEEEENKLRLILRMKECSLHGVFSASLFPNIPSAVELAKMLCHRVSVSRFQPVSYLKAPDLITSFDEHRLSPNFKFGVLYQKEGQLTEEEILSNTEEDAAYQDFLSVLGETVQLQGFSGFRGGLDVCYGQTGTEAVVTSFHGREIMFHVATKLPFTEGDPQQLQRKRHIGNDIVALVYQDGRTPFLSDLIQSHFLHCFLVVRRVDGEGGGATYQVSVTARDDVPPFGPALPAPPLFTDPSQLRDFLLTKLINAEISCYKAQQFSRLELRTRSSLLESLQAELMTRSQCMLGDPPSSSSSSSSEGVRGASEASGGFIENFKRAIRVRSHSFDTLGVPRKTVTASPQRSKVEKDGESDKSAAAETPGTTEVKDPASPQEEI